MDHIQGYLQDLHSTLDLIPRPCIEKFVQILKDARLHDRQVFAMGNGGSAATASHFVADLGKNTRVKGQPHFRVFGLTDNVASITAYANDEGYENIFSQQLAGLIRKNDVVIAISASGNSKNVLKAIELANVEGAITIGLTGFDGGRLASMVHLNIHIPSRRIEQVEDIHMMVEHMVVSAIKEAANELVQNNGEMTAIFSQPAYLLDNFRQLSDPSNRFDAGMKMVDEAKEFIQSSQAFIDDLPNYDTLQRVLQFMVDTVRANSGSILLLGNDGSVTDGFLAYGGKVRTGAPHHLMEILKEGLAGWVIEHDEGVIVADTRSDPRWLASQWDNPESGPRTAISVPLSSQTQVFGVLTLTRNNSEAFTECDLSFLTTLGAFLSINMINRKR
jgi:D-sedoheptulose 7-phosphate isomerase